MFLKVLNIYQIYQIAYKVCFVKRLANLHNICLQQSHICPNNLFIFGKHTHPHATVCPKGQEIIWSFWLPPPPLLTIKATVKFFKSFDCLHMSYLLKCNTYMTSYIVKHNLTQSPVPQYIYIYIYINAIIYQKIKLNTITLIILRFECGVLKLSSRNYWASPLGLWAMSCLAALAKFT